MNGIKQSRAESSMTTRFDLGQEVVLAKTKDWSPYWSGASGTISMITIDEHGIHYSVKFKDDRFMFMMDEDDLELK